LAPGFVTDAFALARPLRLALAALRERADTSAVVGLCALALAIRLGFASRAQILVSKDSFEYLQPAWNLLNGLGFDPLLRRPPLYSLFGATVMGLLGESLAALVFIQHLLGVVAVGLTYWLGRLTFGRAAGLVAGLLVALDSVLILYEHYIQPETLFGLLLLSGCLALVLAWRRGGSRWYLAAGLLLGLAALTRPVAQLVLAAVPLAIVLERGSLRSSWRPSLLVATGAALVLVPWVARNKIVHGTFTVAGSGRFMSARVVKHDQGYVFYDPANANQYDSLGRRARQIFQSEARERPEEGPIYSRYRSELGLSDAETDDLLRQISFEGIARDPAHYLRTTTGAFLGIFAGDQKEELLRWHLRERNQARVMNQWEGGGMRHLLSGTAEEQVVEIGPAESLASIFRPSRWLTPLVVGILLALALGVWKACYRPAVVLVGVVGLTLTASAAFGGEEPRYRYPLDPLICVLAAGGYVGVLEILIRARPRLLRAAPPRVASRQGEAHSSTH
jgi:hypothetical protein